MKLYDAPRKAFLKYTNEYGEVFKIFFDHVDGMYSYCTYNGSLIHLSASTEVEIWNDATDVEHLESTIRI